MTNDENNQETPAQGQGDRYCCASGKWIWLALILAVAAVLIIKQAGPRTTPPRPVGGSPNSAPAVAPRTPAGPVQALPRLVDLGATKCVPCKMMAPILDELKKTYAGKLDVEFIDVWDNAEAGEKYGINLIPTQIFYDAQGKELFRHEGFFSKEDILAKWKAFGVELPVAGPPAETAK